MSAEAEVPQWLRLECGQVFWSGEGISANTCVYDGYAELLGKPVEYLNAGSETELLTSNAVDQGFDQGRELGRLNSAEASGKYRQPGILCSMPIKALEISLQTQHPGTCFA